MYVAMLGTEKQNILMHPAAVKEHVFPFVAISVVQCLAQSVEQLPEELWLQDQISANPTLGFSPFQPVPHN